MPKLLDIICISEMSNQWGIWKRQNIQGVPWHVHDRLGHHHFHVFQFLENRYQKNPCPLHAYLIQMELQLWHLVLLGRDRAKKVKSASSFCDRISYLCYHIMSVIFKSHNLHTYCFRASNRELIEPVEKWQESTSNKSFRTRCIFEK